MTYRALLAALAFATALLTSSAAFGGAKEDADAALRRNDFKAAFALLLPLARKGDAFAQYNVGVMYSQGLGVGQDAAEAFKWYLAAAQQGDASAQSNVGLMYENGRGVAQDYRQAMEWYQKAAQQGNALAQNNIGSVYFNGHGVAKDDAKAAEWFAKAAAQGLPVAQNSLGGLYYKGWGVKQDANTALQWFLKSANQGNADAQKNVYMIYLAEAQHGNAQAMHYTGLACLKQWGGPHEPSECVGWLEKAAGKGMDSSREVLATLYEKGYPGIAPDPKKAAYWRGGSGK